MIFPFRFRRTEEETQKKRPVNSENNEKTPFDAPDASLEEGLVAERPFDQREAAN